MFHNRSGSNVGDLVLPEQPVADLEATRRPASPHCGTVYPEHRPDEANPNDTTNMEGLL